MPCCVSPVVLHEIISLTLTAVMQRAELLERMDWKLMEHWSAEV